ncbi:MAG: trimethylamine methyltransferase family protein [bacterium]|nr:trimethylamine methyltransferase family protein [bacterium]
MKPKFFEILSQEEIVQIDTESRRILEECGIRILNDECLELLEGIGCKIDRSSKIVKMSSDVVRKAIESTPEKFSLYGRDPSYKLDVGGNNVYFGPGGFAVFVEDLETGKRRRAIRKDLIEHLRISDALPGCEFNHVNVFPSDVPEKTGDLHLWAEALIYQTKPIMSENYNPKSVDALVKMGTVLRGSQEEFIKKPLICLDMCCLSPLSQDTRQVELLMSGAKYGLPISIESGPIGGGSSPVTLASIVSQANAEILSAIVITYAVKPGTPVLYGSWGRHLDMKYTTVTMGGPEYALQKVCMAQMGRYYKLPTRGGGVLTDSLISDTQSGYEKMMTALIPAIGGINYISGMGLNETENCQSLAQLVIDDEIVAMVKRIMRGIKVDTEHLATDIIISKGPGGSFLETEHTLNYFREHFDPKISNRKVYERWVNDGSKTTKERAAEKAREILNKKPEHTLDSKIVNEIYNIVREVEGNG